jgi:hypothetical protein
MRKRFSLFSIALFLAGMLVIGSQSPFVGSQQISEANENRGDLQKDWKATSKMVRKVDSLPKQRCLNLSLQGIKEEVGNAELPSSEKELSKFQGQKDVTYKDHPALTDGGGGYLVKFWEDIVYQVPTLYTLQMRGSIDTGATWYTPTVWSVPYPPGYPGYFPQSDALPRYPSLKHWGPLGAYEHVFYGTCVCPPEYHAGGEPQIFVIKNIMDDTTWAKWRWAFDVSAGTANMKSAEIAVDTGQTYENPLAEDRPWGIQGLILSKPLSYIDAPHLFWQFKEDGYALLSYYSGLENCQSIYAAIDPVTADAYTCWDWPDPNNGDQYVLYIRRDPWDLMPKESNVTSQLAWKPQLSGWYMTDPTLNLEHPVMAAHDGNLVILTEVVNTVSDNVDIVSWHCYDGDPAHLGGELSYLGYVAHSIYKERYPEIAWVEDNYFIATYWQDYKLYACKSCGGGAWSDSVQVSLVGDSVLMDYHVADLSDHGTKLIYSYLSGGNHELRMVNLGLGIFPSSTQAPYLPYCWSPVSGSTGVPPDSVVLVWAGGDQDGDCITYDIYLGTDNPPPWVATQSVKETYQPGTLLPFTTYYWMITATDDQGMTASSVSNFTTGAPVPHVLSLSPSQNDLAVPVTSNISVVFDCDMEPATLNNSTVLINARSTGRHQGTISYDAPTKTLTFDPFDDFAVGEEVSVTLTSDILSSYGVSLYSYVWSFTTQTNVAEGVFGPDSTYTVSTKPRGVFAADLDGDGDLDLAIANEATDRVSIMRNLGNGKFASPSVYIVGDGPVSIFVADFDRDGDLDIATANSLSDNVSILLNNGAATFAPQSAYAAGDMPRSVFASDLNGDGYPDLAVANEGNDNVSILLNLGSGIFAAQSTYSGVGDAPWSVVSADLDGDGDFDLVTANANSDNVGILLNQGNGTFTLQSKYPTDDSCRYVIASDLDGDGDADLATANSNADNVSVLMNNGDATFAPAVPYTVGDNPVSLFANDLDGDGDPDLLVADADVDRVSVLMNNGNGTFAPHSLYQVGDSPRSLFAADVENDGDIDLVTANWLSNNISVLFSFLRGDVNADGVIDAADVVYLTNYLYIHGPKPLPLAAGDVNCDGNTDAADVVYLTNYLYIHGPAPGCP